MATHEVRFDRIPEPVYVPTGTLLSEAARLAGIEITQPCGGQGRCGRCTVRVTKGTVRRRSTLRLSTEDVLQGYALACQSVIEGDVSVFIPPQEKIERRLATDRTVAEIKVPDWYRPEWSQPIKRIALTLVPPNLEDQTDDWSRLQTAIRQQTGVNAVAISLDLLRQIGGILRERDWRVTVILDASTDDIPNKPARLISVVPGHFPHSDPLWAVAIDIGTTTVTVWLVDLTTGRVAGQISEYNGQISRGEDVISRIVYASKNGGGEELKNLVTDTIKELIQRICLRVGIDPAEIIKATIAGNSTMIHLLLGISAASIRLSPFITAVNQVPLLLGEDLGLNIHPKATVDCLPGVASYVGADISAGVLSSGLDDTDKMTLFMDVGTNGEIVLGMREWLVTCACSAGPAFEGAGVLHGMRATTGAIEEVWINSTSLEPTVRVIGNGKPRGLCGSGLISLLAELFMTGLVDKAGNINLDAETTRVRNGQHGPEYVVAWANETLHGKDIFFTRVDIDNLLRAKAAIYAGYVVLANSVGVSLDMVEQLLIGGSFGKYINVEKAVQIGLLPDLPWDHFQFLGNTAVLGAYFALLDQIKRKRLRDIASKMTYIELSADNQFFEAFMSAMFLPHTDLDQFPSVAADLVKAPVG
jgi:uncharacterized 2Fe-2S/4Fe-4S cluster protein (DUF4445 family)